MALALVSSVKKHPLWAGTHIYQVLSIEYNMVLPGDIMDIMDIRKKSEEHNVYHAQDGNLLWGGRSCTGRKST